MDHPGEITANSHWLDVIGGWGKYFAGQVSLPVYSPWGSVWPLDDKIKRNEVKLSPGKAFSPAIVLQKVRIRLKLDGFWAYQGYPYSVAAGCMHCTETKHLDHDECCSNDGTGCISRLDEPKWKYLDTLWSKIQSKWSAISEEGNDEDDGEVPLG